jgi:predicted outer membrane repeat protein
VEFETDIFVHKTTLVNSTTIEIEITALNSTPPGWYDITVKNRDFQKFTLPAAIEVLPTTRHYFSPTGGDNFPYIYPGDAATSIEDAIDASWEGDTLFVPSMTFDNFTTPIVKGVLLHGAWNMDFTARDLTSGKTVIHPLGDVLIAPSADKAGLDGFVVEYGHGGGLILPFIAAVGGGVRIIGADATIANCEIRFNTTTLGSDIGAGGGIFADSGTVDIRDNYIHDNAGTVGGGLFLYACDGTVTGNTISANSVTQILELPYGAGVQIVNCDNLTLVDNTIEGNTGARDGGGIFIENSTNITIEGGTIADHSVAFQGGGIYAKLSEIGLTDVVFDRNSSMLGGGISATDASSITASGCGFLWNSAAVGGGMYLPAEHSEVHHNLFVGNSATGSAAAIFITGATTGAVMGNTLDRNAAGSGSGGIQVSSSPMDVFNNIVTNTTGHGIAASGSPQPWVGYNLVWNSSGSDYDGTTAGDGGVAGDPVFADTSAGDFHLGPHSPAIDAGRPGAAYDDPDGSRGDMGWYGSHALTMEQPSYPKNLTAYNESGDVVLRWDQNPEPDVDTYYVYCDSVSGFKPSVSNVVATVSAADTSANMGAPGDSTYYLVGAVDSDGYASGFSNEVFRGPATGAGERVAYENHLYQNVPNPFNPTTTIEYELRSQSAVMLDVYDVMGRSVKRLVDGQIGAGIHKVTWDGTNGTGERVSSGIYFYRLDTGAFVQTRKMLLLK